MKILRQNIEITHHAFLQVAFGKKNRSMVFQKILLGVVPTRTEESSAELGESSYLDKENFGFKL